MAHRFKLAFKVGDHVAVSGISTDSGIVDGVAVSALSPKGEVVKARLTPPHIDDKRPENPSPHYLVKLVAPDGRAVAVWFTEPRLAAA
jgi:hypothetical protein